MKKCVKLIPAAAVLFTSVILGGTALAADIWCTAGVLCEGTNRKDVLIGSFGKDTITGGDGHDIISGSFGDDKLYGQKGNDEIYAVENDRRSGGGFFPVPGKGTPGIDLVDGGTGNDTIRAADGIKDVIDCGEGTDTVEYDRTLDVIKNCETLIPVG